HHDIEANNLAPPQLMAIVSVLLVASMGSAYGSESVAPIDENGSTDHEKPASAAPTAAAPITVLQGFGLFQQRCLSCHGNPAFKEAPSPEALREMPPEHVYEVLS